MVDFCRIKIVGENLKELGLLPYKELLSGTNSFILDITKNINSTKNVTVSEHPTYPDGRMRIAQTIVNNETLTIEGNLSKYNTITERNNVDIRLFREFLEKLIEEAVLLDIETESKSHYNFILHANSVGQTGVGTISVSLQLREAWLIEPAQDVSPGNLSNKKFEAYNDINKTQAMRNQLEKLHTNLISSKNGNPYRTKDPAIMGQFLAEFFEGALLIGKSNRLSHSKVIRTIPIKKAELVVDNKYGFNPGNDRMPKEWELAKALNEASTYSIGSGTAKGTAIKYTRLAYLSDRPVDRVNYSTIPSDLENITVKVNLPSRQLHGGSGEYSNLINQVVYPSNVDFNSIAREHPDVIKAQETNKISYEIHTIGEQGNKLITSMRQTLSHNHDRASNTSTTLSNTPFKVTFVQGRFVITLDPVGVLRNYKVGVIYSTIIISNNTMSTRFNYISPAFTKAVFSVINNYVDKNKLSVLIDDSIKMFL